MTLALCMVVRNEEGNLGPCLDSVVGEVDQVVVLDDRSTDRTAELLVDSWGIRPLACFDDVKRHMFELRNLALAEVREPWVLVLDADERVSPAAVAKLRQALDATDADGLFVSWNTHVGQSVVQDYKLAVFRNGYRYEGLVHETVQPNFRARNARAEWFDGLTIRHCPSVERLPAKRRFFRWALRHAIATQPDWTRYHWFLGYSLYRSGAVVAAQPWLQAAAEGTARFPVERLNARMVLAEIAAIRDELDLAGRNLREAQSLHSRVREDFEVRINTRMRPWLQGALNALESGHVERIRAYEFGY